jgi:eukaryotic-like serine/threonine-protein kinase
MLESRQELSARFILVRRLGAGGSGEVWLAQDRERGCLVAVKVLADDLMQDVAAVAALQRECDLVRSLSHRNILPIDGLHRSARHVWIAMEYASGGDLSLLRGRGCVEILRAVMPVAAALAHAHGAGVVHRDVKPANVLLTSDGTPRLADFGIALALATAPAANAGRGSPHSMSPQQRTGAPASPADDIYSFGAMLYELLSGYPKPAPLPGSVPARVAQFVEKMLSEDPKDRPADMQAVEAELSAALAELPAPALIKTEAAIAPVRVEPPSMRPSAQGEPLRGEWRRGSASHTRGDRGPGFRRGLAAAGIVAGVVGLVVVFFALPRWVGDGKPERAVQAQQALKPEKPVEEKKEIDFAALARDKQRAEEIRAANDERLKKLVERAAEQWGGEEFKRANAELADGDKDYEAREYSAAATHFEAMTALLETLEGRAPEVLAAQLANGAKALQEGRSADAKAAFELAAKLDPKNQVTVRGLKRATTLDEVLNLVATAERMEKEGNASAATETFRKALALDAEAPRAAEAIARIEARLASDAFASAMARGYGALASRDHGSARSAFEDARKIRPNAPEIPQALRQIEQEQRTGVIATKLGTAGEHESQERWGDALKEYRAIVELDSTIAAAQEGVARVSPRAALNEQLELYLTQPERLFSQSVRAAAHDSLAHAASINNPGPVLQRQVVKLREWLERADVPVPVALQSDNLTQVTIYRVGALGTFAERSLTLAPGSYTVVGTRPGYRDVRREINVMPGGAPEPVIIRCEDRI